MLIAEGRHPNYQRECPTLVSRRRWTWNASNTVETQFDGMTTVSNCQTEGYAWFTHLLAQEKKKRESIAPNTQIATRKTSGRDLTFLKWMTSLSLKLDFFANGNGHISSGGGTLRDVQIPQSASLEIINETVHPQILSAASPRIPHGGRTDNVLDLGTDARLDDFRQRLRFGDTLEVERPSEGDERREPARERRRRFGRRGARGHGFEACCSTAAPRMANDKN